MTSDQGWARDVLWPGGHIGNVYIPPEPPPPPQGHRSNSEYFAWLLVCGRPVYQAIAFLHSCFDHGYVPDRPWGGD